MQHVHLYSACVCAYTCGLISWRLIMIFASVDLHDHAVYVHTRASTPILFPVYNENVHAYVTRHEKIELIIYVHKI